MGTIINCIERFNMIPDPLIWDYWEYTVLVLLTTREKHSYYQARAQNLIDLLEL